MGMFDTIIANCPNCGLESEFQSKSGDCLLKYYKLYACPEDVLLDANRHSPNECSCGALFEIDIENRKAIYYKNSNKTKK